MSSPAAPDTPRLAAFFRGINLGSRRVKMADLRAHLEDLGLEDVATLLASGNAVFAGGGGDTAGLERRIEDHLEEALGFATRTFVRPVARLKELAAMDVVDERAGEGFDTYVTFLREEAGDGVEAGLRSLETPDDRFRVLGREVLWFRRGGLSDSPIATRDLERILGPANTRRKIDTIRRMVSKFGD